MTRELVVNQNKYYIFYGKIVINFIKIQSCNEIENQLLSVFFLTNKLLS